MNRHHLLRLAALIACGVAAVNGSASAQTDPAPPGGGLAPSGREGLRLAWDQPLDTRGQPLRYDARLWIDGAPAAFLDVECTSGSARALACSGGLPPLSEGAHTLQVSAVVDGVQSSPSAPLSTVVSALMAGSGRLGVDVDAPAAGPRCGGAARPCFVAETLTSLAADISSLMPTADGRVLFIENRQHVRVWSEGSLLAAPALSVDRGTQRLVALALAADYAQTRAVFVAWTEDTAAGKGALTVARYRDVGNQFAQRLILVSDLPLGTDDDPIVAFDAANRIYVAVPKDADSGSEGPYAGALLRLSPEGRVVWDAGQSSIVLAHGIDHPAALLASVALRSAWLAGTNGAGMADVRSVPATADAAPLVTAWFRTLESLAQGPPVVALSAPPDVPNLVHAMDRDGVVHRIFVEPDGSVSRIDAPSFDTAGPPISLAAATADTFYVTTANWQDGRRVSSVIRVRAVPQPVGQHNR